MVINTKKGANLVHGIYTREIAKRKRLTFKIYKIKKLHKFEKEKQLVSITQS